MSNPTPSFITHPNAPAKPVVPAPKPAAPKPAVQAPTVAASIGHLKYSKPGNNPPAPPAITVPTVNGVPQTDLPHMPPGYSYR